MNKPGQYSTSLHRSNGELWRLRRWQKSMLPAFVAMFVLVCAKNACADEDINPLHLLDGYVETEKIQDPQTENKALVPVVIKTNTPNEPTSNEPAEEITEPESQKKTGKENLKNDRAGTKYEEKQPFTSNSNEIVRKLWNARLSAIDDTAARKQKGQLQRLIEQIQSVEFKPDSKKKSETKKKPGEPRRMDAAKPNQPPEPNVGQIKPMVIPHKKSEPNLPYEPVRDDTVKQLESLSEQDAELTSPFDLAEILYCSGRLKSAAKFYHLALSMAESGKGTAPEDKAWIIFQIGNCLRKSDQEQASKMYKRLINQYPDSPWAQCARKQDQLLEWLRDEKPRQLLAKDEE